MILNPLRIIIQFSSSLNFDDSQKTYELCLLENVGQWSQMMEFDLIWCFFLQVLEMFIAEFIDLIMNITPFSLKKYHFACS